MIEEYPSRPFLLNIFLYLILINSGYQAIESLSKLLGSIIRDTLNPDLFLGFVGFMMSVLIAVFVYLVLKWKKVGLYGFVILMVGSSVVGSLYFTFTLALQ